MARLYPDHRTFSRREPSRDDTGSGHQPAYWDGPGNLSFLWAATDYRADQCVFWVTAGRGWPHSVSRPLAFRAARRPGAALHSNRDDYRTNNSRNSHHYSAGASNQRTSLGALWRRTVH